MKNPSKKAQQPAATAQPITTDLPALPLLLKAQEPKTKAATRKKKPTKAKKAGKPRKQVSKPVKKVAEAAPAHVNRLANVSDHRKVTRILKQTGNAHAAKHAKAIAATRNGELISEILKQK